MKTEQLTFFSLFDRSTLVHLRIPFSFFLMPVFCFALSQAQAIDWMNVFVVFVALHLFIYPGSNLYNSYTDKDTGSIGGLKNPPPATKKLYYSSIFFDVAGLAICLLVNWRMLLLMLVYIIISKAYSWPGIRLKRYGILAWLVVALFQGAYTFLMVGMASENSFNVAWISAKNAEAMLLTALLIGGFYPFTQIYQHDEDSGRGDKTLSYRLGIYGTFIFSGIVFIVACVLGYHYFLHFYSEKHFFVFTSCLLPVTVYYFYWLLKTRRDRSHADYVHTMRMTFISSISMMVCFILLFLLNHA